MNCCGNWLGHPTTTQGAWEVKGESYEKEQIWLSFLPSPTEILGKIALPSAAPGEKANRALPPSSLSA